MIEAAATPGWCRIYIMKTMFFLAIIVAAAAAGYFFFIADSPVYSTYKKFATAVAYGHREEALEDADSEDVLGGPEENRGQNTGGMPVEALTGISYTRESEAKNSDGTVTVQAIQSVRFDPPGATSAMGAMTSKYRQTATLQKAGDRWLVTSFDSELLETRNWKGEKE